MTRPDFIRSRLSMAEVDAVLLDRDQLLQLLGQVRESCDKAADHIESLATERDTLAAENQHLREQGRLVEAERDRFREVLQAIDDYRPDPEDKADPYLQIAVHTMRTAREALGLYTFKPSNGA